MSEWKEFLKRRKGVLLTLPGAALWSLPIGVWGWNAIPGYIPWPASIDGGKLLVLAALILTPISAVCSMIAMLRFIDGRDKVPPFVAAVLGIFNFATAFVTASVILIAVVGLARGFG